MNMIAFRSVHRQEGVVLVVAMIMLVLLTLIGLAGMRTTLLEERMAGNLRDRNLAFQSAEAALREGEMSGPTACAVAGGFDGTDGCYDLPTVCQNDDDADDVAACWVARNEPADTSVWSAADWESDGRTPVNAIPLVDEQPRYVVERITTTSKKKDDSLKAGGEYEEITYYRVTARGVGGNANTVAIVQSTYRP